MRSRALQSWSDQHELAFFGSFFGHAKNEQRAFSPPLKIKFAEPPPV
jgi:hypothetical protein